MTLDVPEYLDCRCGSRVRVHDILTRLVPVESGCHEYTDGQLDGGYGKRCHLWVHRVVWSLHNGPIPAGLVVRHSCDNPPCANPAHLLIGTQGDNMRDAASRGRMGKADVRGERNPFAKVTERMVLEIRAAVAGGATRTQVAHDLGLSRSAVGQIVSRSRWAHVQ